MNWAVVIPAAGKGTRFGSTDIPKVLHPLNKQPLLLHTLRALKRCERFEQIVIATDPSLFDPIKKLAEPLNLADRLRLVEGGEQRGDSVFAGLQALNPCAFVAIHDAARPILTPTLMDALAKATLETGAAVPGFPVRDTLKRCEPGIAATRTTVSRQSLWMVQTPQCFRYELILRAYKEAQRLQIKDTDDAALVERLGLAVSLVAGDIWNIKITYPEDVAVAEIMLGRNHV